MDDSQGMLWLTFGLLVFAGVQLWVQHRSEIARQAESQAELDRAADIAWQIAHAEHFRLNALAEVWKRQDIVLLSAIGILDARDVLPRDWATVMRALAEMGVEAGTLGAVAMTLSHDLARDVASLNAVVAASAMHLRSGATPEAVSTYARAAHKETLDKIVAKIQSNIRELAAVIGDAALHSPRASVERELEFRDDMKSRMGRKAAERMANPHEAE